MLFLSALGKRELGPVTQFSDRLFCSSCEWDNDRFAMECSFCRAPLNGSRTISNEELLSSLRDSCSFSISNTRQHGWEVM